MKFGHMRLTETTTVLTTPLWDLVLTSSFRTPYPGERGRQGIKKKGTSLYCTAWIWDSCSKNKHPALPLLCQKKVKIWSFWSYQSPCWRYPWQIFPSQSMREGRPLCLWKHTCTFNVEHAHRDAYRSINLTDASWDMHLHLAAGLAFLQMFWILHFPWCNYET